MILLIFLIILFICAVCFNIFIYKSSNEKFYKEFLKYDVSEIRPHKFPVKIVLVHPIPFKSVRLAIYSILERITSILLFEDCIIIVSKRRANKITYNDVIAVEKGPMYNYLTLKCGDATQYFTVKSQKDCDLILSLKEKNSAHISE